jgi:hypothetical protein
MFNRDDNDDAEDEEEVINLKHRPDSLTVINTLIQEKLAPVETQPVVKHRSILHQ